MPFWSNKTPSRVRRQVRRDVPYRRYSMRNQPSSYNSAIRRWFFCALVMLAVTALNYLPFRWAATSQTYLSYFFQPGAAAATPWAAWADWQSDNGLITTVWRQLTGTDADEGLAYPCSGQITSAYAWRHHPVTGQVEMHYGIDIQNEAGTPVQAAAAGTVRETAEEQTLGIYVVLDHGDGLVTRYAHLAEASVAAGDTVAKGQEVGKLGSTGMTETPHLHFEVIVDGKPVDPLSVLPR